jgi:hypothetical protein
LNDYLLHLGDNLSAAWGILLIALPSPIMIPTMVVSVKIWDWIQAYIISKQKIVSLVDQASAGTFAAPEAPINVSTSDLQCLIQKTLS